MSGGLSPASVYVGLLPVGEACVVAACWSRPGFELINDYRQKGYKEDLKNKEQAMSLLPAQSGYPTGASNK